MIARNGSLDGIRLHLQPCSPRGTLTLSRPDHGIWGRRQTSMCRITMLFAAACSTVSSLLSLGRRGKVCSRPGLSSGRDAAGYIPFEPPTREGSTWQMAIKTTYQNQLREDEGIIPR